jgi:hypothetical protein
VADGEARAWEVDRMKSPPEVARDILDLASSRRKLISRRAQRYVIKNEREKLLSFCHIAGAAGLGETLTEKADNYKQA